MKKTSRCRSRMFQELNANFMSDRCTHQSGPKTGALRLQNVCVSPKRRKNCDPKTGFTSCSRVFSATSSFCHSEPSQVDDSAVSFHDLTRAEYRGHKGSELYVNTRMSVVASGAALFPFETFQHGTGHVTDPKFSNPSLSTGSYDSVCFNLDGDQVARPDAPT